MNNFVVTVNEKEKKEIKLNGNALFLDEKKIEYSVLSSQKNHIIIQIDGRIYNLVYSRKGNQNYQILLNGQTFDSEVLTNLQYKAKEIIAEKKKNSGEETILAPMPGLILKLNKKAGDSVQENEALFVLEAMKMENEIKAEKSGIVKEIKVQEGASVEKGAEILVLE